MSISQPKKTQTGTSTVMSALSSAMSNYKKHGTMNVPKKP